MEQREREKSRTECSRKDEQRRESEKSEWMEHGEWMRARIMELLTCGCKALTHQSLHLMKHWRQKLNSWWKTHDWHGCKVNKHTHKHTCLILWLNYNVYIRNIFFFSILYTEISGTQQYSFIRYTLSLHILVHLLHITTKPFIVVYLTFSSR